jgi:type VI secretion system protein ImpJ
MSANSKVVWSEGLFLQQQHFQQQDRYLERYIESRCEALAPYGWGFAELELEQDLLGIGKLSIRRGTGVCPDGTPFRIPDDDPLPAPLEVGPETRDQIVYLAIPVRRSDTPEVGRPGDPDGLSRHVSQEYEARDSSLPSGDTATLSVGPLRTRLLLDSDRTDAYACVPVARILECRPDKRVLLDEAFMPTVLRTRAATRLATFIQDVVGKLHQRGEALAGRAVATARGAATQIEEYLTLQIINRWQPVLAHISQSGDHHPEAVYRVLLALAGDLATYTLPTRRPPELPAYRHDRLRESFEPLMSLLSTELSVVLEPNAIRIALDDRGWGIRVAVVPDRALFSQAMFVLAAKADMPAEELRRQFPAQLKVGAVERIRDLVMLSLAGVPVQPLPVAPRQIPFRAGFAYFELDRTNELWQQVQGSGGMAVHAGTEFPGLELECWAIRS